MKALKKLSNNQIQVSAKCHICQKKADFTHRTIDNSDLVVVGHNDLYQARCEEHWHEGMQGRI